MVEFGPRWIYQPKCDYGQTVIKVVVGTGDGEKTFTVHKNLLCAASDYFERELNCPSFTESQEMKVTLEEDIPSTFEVLQRWVYSGKVDDSRSYTGGDDLHEDHFWLRVYQLADFLGVRAVQVIAFERFETVFPCTKPIVLPSKEFIKELYETKASPKALQVYVAGHTAYWMLRVSKKAEKWAALLASQPYYGMDTATVLAKLLPLQTLHPEGFPRAHPAHRRGSFAVDSGLDLDGLRRDANARIMLAEQDVAERPALGTFCSAKPASEQCYPYCRRSKRFDSRGWARLIG